MQLQPGAGTGIGYLPPSVPVGASGAGSSTPWSSQCIDTPSAAAIFRSVSLRGFVTAPRSIMPTCACATPARALRPRALRLNLARASRTRDANEPFAEVSITDNSLGGDYALVQSDTTKPADKMMSACAILAPMPQESIRDRVRWILKNRGFKSQRELAARAGLASSHISLILNNLGDHIEAKTLEKIAGAAGVSYDWLATGRGTPLAGVEPPSPPPTEDETSLERAVFRAIDHDRHEAADYQAACRAVRESARSLVPGTDPREFARLLLDSAAQLRREGLPTTPAAVLGRAATSRHADARQRADLKDAAFTAEVDERVRAAGREPGDRAEAFKAALAKAKKK